MEAWVTLTTNDEYSVGALTLAASLRRVHTTRQLVVLVTAGVSSQVRTQLEAAFDRVVTVEELDSGDLANLSLLDRVELGITFTKVRCWMLTDYTKCVFLDADTLVVQNCDELFQREEFSAAPDCGWPDCFNSGVFVFRPNLNTYRELVQHATATGSFDGGDQGLLNTFFGDWATKDISRHLPFTYNMVASATYSYLPAFKQFGQQVKIVHFIGPVKPWLASFDSAGKPVLSGVAKHTQDHLRLWWQLFNNQVRPGLQREAGAGVAALHTVTAADYMQPPAQPKEDSRAEWEQGSPDYMGTASFENIQKKMDDTLSK